MGRTEERGETNFVWRRGPLCPAFRSSRDAELLTRGVGGLALRLCWCDGTFGIELFRQEHLSIESEAGRWVRRSEQSRLDYAQAIWMSEKGRR
jgi:hypothetical protein